MRAAPPFDGTDLPGATRVVPAPVAAVFAVVTDVARWPSWVPGMLDPVVAQGQDQFLFRMGPAPNPRHLTVRVILRTHPVTFAVESGDQHQIWVRTRPSTGGSTEAQLVLRPNPDSGFLARLRWHRGARARSRWAEATLEALARFIGESKPGAAP